MERASHLPDGYQLNVTGGLTGKLGVKTVSGLVGHIWPVTRLIERNLDQRFPQLQGPSRHALQDHAVGLAARMVYDKLHHAKTTELLESDMLAPVKSEVFPSSVTKLTATIAHDGIYKKATCFVDPVGYVPFSFRPIDLIPHDETKLPVSASLSYLARKSDDLSVIHMTSSGWSGLTACADRIDLQPSNGVPATALFRNHLDATTVSLDTRADFPYFSIDDFFERISLPHEDDTPIVSPQFRPQEAHWLVTKKDGSFAVQSRSQLQAQNEMHPLFKNTIASISSLLAYVDEAIVTKSQEYTASSQIVNALVLFDLDGEKRIGSLHAGFQTNAVSMFTLAKTMIEQHYPHAQNIAIGVIDGGGSSGAIVKTRSDLTTKRMDTSTLPLLPSRHEIAMFTGMIPSDLVSNKYAEIPTEASEA